MTLFPKLVWVTRNLFEFFHILRFWEKSFNRCVNSFELGMLPQTVFKNKKYSIATGDFSYEPQKQVHDFLKIVVANSTIGSLFISSSLFSQFSHSIHLTLLLSKVRWKSMTPLVFIGDGFVIVFHLVYDKSIVIVN